LYTPIFKPVGLGEIAMIVGFSMISVGTYVSMFNTENYLLTINDFLVFLLPGLWKSTVLIINEFPDYENDKKANVKNWIVRFGYKGTALIYFFMMIIFYSTVVYLFIIDFFNVWALASLITVPLFLKIFVNSMNYKNLEKHLLIMRQQVNLGYISLGVISLSLFFM
ncbi:MAG: prenyltransferase, partial [bacterium]